MICLGSAALPAQNRPSQLKSAAQTAIGEQAFGLMRRHGPRQPLAKLRQRRQGAIAELGEAMGEQQGGPWTKAKLWKKTRRLRRQQPKGKEVKDLRVKN